MIASPPLSWRPIVIAVAVLVVVATGALVGDSAWRVHAAQRANQQASARDGLLYDANGGIEWATAALAKDAGRCSATTTVRRGRDVTVPLALPGLRAVVTCQPLPGSGANSRLVELTEQASLAGSTLVERAVALTTLRPSPPVVTLQRWWVASS